MISALRVSIFGLLWCSEAENTNEDNNMTLENLAQLQYLLKKYSNYKHQVREDEEEQILTNTKAPEQQPKRRIKRSKGKKAHREKHVITESIHPSSHARSESFPTKSIVSSCCSGSEDCCGDSMYSSLVNSLYSWYYGPKSTTSENTPSTDSEENPKVSTDAKNIKKISQYVRKHGHHFDHDVGRLRERDLKQLLMLIHGDSSHQDPTQEDPKKKSDLKFSPAQKGIIAGVVTVVILLILAGIAFFSIKKYGFPKSFVQKTRYVTRRERDVPLRPPGPNVGHIYPPP